MINPIYFWENISSNICCYPDGPASEFNGHWVTSIASSSLIKKWSMVFGVLCNWWSNVFSHVCFPLPHSLHVYPSNLLLIPSSFLPTMSVSPSSSLSLSVFGANIPLPIYPLLPPCPPPAAFLSCLFLPLLLLTSSFSLHLSVCDSQERGEECSEHVWSPKIPPGSGD